MNTCANGRCAFAVVNGVPECHLSATWALLLTYHRFLFFQHRYHLVRMVEIVTGTGNKYKQKTFKRQAWYFQLRMHIPEFTSIFQVVRSVTLLGRSWSNSYHLHISCEKSGKTENQFIRRWNNSRIILETRRTIDCRKLLEDHYFPTCDPRRSIEITFSLLRQYHSRLFDNFCLFSRKVFI